MGRLDWHNKIIQALWDVHSTHGFKPLDPCVVYFRLSDHRVIRYRPDFLALRVRKGTHAVVIEAETASPPKSIAGDILLASLVNSRWAEMYPWHWPNIGSALRHDRVFRDAMDSRTPAQVIRADDRKFLPGIRIGKLSFLLLARDKTHQKYYKRFLDLFVRKQWGRRSPFANARCISCRATSLASARRSMGRILAGL